MLCEKCGKREATMHLRESVNGDVREIHLCAQCAHEMGYDDIFVSDPTTLVDLGSVFQSFLGGLFSNSIPVQEIPTGKRCPSCGTTFEDIAKSAMTGCPDCYKTFYDELLPTIRRIHGKTHHVGKIPGSAGKDLKRKRNLANLKRELDDAVAKQEYEKAAALRDQIRDMEKKEG